MQISLSLLLLSSRLEMESGWEEASLLAVSPPAPPAQEVWTRGSEDLENREVSKGVLEGSANNCEVSEESEGDAEELVSHEVSISKDCMDVGSEISRL